MFHIIINLNSGNKKAKKALAKTEAILDANKTQYTLHPTEYAGHAQEIAAELTKSGNADIIVMGGDGTFNEVLNGIVCFDNVRLGLIPCGTGNDFVRATDIPTKTEDAVYTILQGNTRYIDYIQLDEKRAINCAGAGMDVDTLVKYAEIKHLYGKIKYYVALLSVLTHLKFHKARVTAEDKNIESNVFIVAATNGTCIGGGMPLSPYSVVDDGLMDVVVIKEIRKREVLGMLLKFLKGKHITEPCVEHFRTDAVTLELLDDGKTEVDGEVFEGKILNCRCVHGKLNLFYRS
ncbi:MAG: diacylglycerol kinase family lipid kinase [Corallococcus sp.]|nr:diacylglycerol kinase family lipid kinase [Corallococcus sp.]